MHLNVHVDGYVYVSADVDVDVDLDCVVHVYVDGDVGVYVDGDVGVDVVDPKMIPALKPQAWGPSNGGKQKGGKVFNTI